MLRSTRAPGSTTQPEKMTAGPTTSPDTSLSPSSEHALAPVDQARGHERTALAGQVVEVGLEVRRRRAGVEPVGVVGPGEEAAVAHHGREGLPLDGDPAALGDPRQDGRLEHVGPGVDLVGRRLVARRLLDEGGDPALRVGRHHAEGRRIGHRMQGDRPLGAALAVEGHEAGQVEVGEHVAVHHDEGLGDAGERRGKAHRARRVERLGLDGVGQPRPRRPGRPGTPP